jgi:hypothetical protein
VTPPESRQPGVVYRYFDDASTLLYVGATFQATSKRWEQHQLSSAWACFVARRAADPFGDVQDAYEAEIAAIRSEKPVFNRRHNQTKDAQDRLRGYLEQHGRLDLLPTLAIKLNREQVEGLQDRIATRAAQEADGNRAEMTRRLIIYGLRHMPANWTPPAITDDHLLGISAWTWDEQAEGTP